MHPFSGTKSSSSDRVKRHGREVWSRDAWRKSRCGGFPASRRGLVYTRSMGSSAKVRERRRQRGVLKTPPGNWNVSDPGSHLPWLGKGDDALAETSCSVSSALSLQSMPLSGGQENNTKHVPTFNCFMRHQEKLQALLVDIHADPHGFKEYVETERDALAETLGDAVVAAASAGRESLWDYTNLSEVGQGQFSVVFYGENKRTRHPCAMKRVELVHANCTTSKTVGNSYSTSRTDRASASMAQCEGTGGKPLLSQKSARGVGGVTVNEEGDEREGGGGRGKKNGGGRKNARKAMTFEHCLKEVGLLKNLASPNIVQLHTWFLDGNALWVVMDWVDGGDLKGMLERTKKAGNRLSELTIWRLFAQVCDALFHMHGERIMHRDLKPANVLLCRDGTVKLGDLGLGRYLNVHSVMAMSRVGTPLYMSPETLKGRGHGMVSDIWSLGCILYELTMLASPFEGKHPTLKTLFSKIVRADYPPVDGTLYNEHFGNLVAHLLIPDPNLRPKITVVQPAAHLALLRAEQDAVEYLHAEQLAAAVDAKCGGFY